MTTCFLFHKYNKQPYTKNIGSLITSRTFKVLELLTSFGEHFLLDISHDFPETKLQLLYEFRRYQEPCDIKQPKIVPSETSLGFVADIHLKQNTKISQSIANVMFLDKLVNFSKFYYYVQVPVIVFIDNLPVFTMYFPVLC